MEALLHSTRNYRGASDMARSSPRHVSVCIPVWRLLGGRGIGRDDTILIGNCARQNALLQDVCVYIYICIYADLHVSALLWLSRL